MGRLSAGVARRDVNPPKDVNLCGYAGRIPGNVGVRDDLYAKALVLSDGERTAAIATADLIGLAAKQVDEIRSRASAATGIPAGNILVNASHTHSGPASQPIRACGAAAEPYVGELLGKIAETIEAAARELRPARFGFGTAESDVAVNRRHRAADGEIQLAPNVGGTTDPEVGIWQFTGEDGKPIATIFNYAAHAVVMDGANRLVSGDWPGAAARAIEAEVGGQAMFLQGCCGNINPRYRATFDEVDRAGREVAGPVLAALPNIEVVREAELDIRAEVVQLPLQPPPSVEEAERAAQEMEDALAKMDDSTERAQVDITKAFRDWARRIVSAGGKGRASMPFEIQRFSVGDAHIIGLPGEVFVEYALQLKRAGTNVMVAGYANGNIGYVPTREAFGEGGYEIDIAHKLYGEQLLSPDVEDVIVHAGAQLLGA